MKTAFAWIAVACLAAACGGQEAQSVENVEEPVVEKQISPELQAKADDFVDACGGAVEFGATVTTPECRCMADAIIAHVEPEGAAKFFEETAPLYRIEDQKRREDWTDRYFRDLLLGADAEARPSWNTVFADAFPVCFEGREDA